MLRCFTVHSSSTKQKKKTLFRTLSLAFRKKQKKKKNEAENEEIMYRILTGRHKEKEKNPHQCSAV